MTKPKSKKELLDLGEKKYQKLLALIDSYPEEQIKRTFPKGTLNRNIKDVLAHLHHWHTMMRQWYTVGMSGEKPAMPAPGYTWRTLPDLNKKIWRDYRNHDMEEVRKKLEDSHRDIRQMIEQHSDEELFEKKRYPWTGSTSLGAYLISNTSSHYAWAYKLIKKAMKGLT